MHRMHKMSNKSATNSISMHIKIAVLQLAKRVLSAVWVEEKLGSLNVE